MARSGHECACGEPLGTGRDVQGVTWIIRDCSALLPGTKLCTTSAKNVSLWNDGLSTMPTPTVSTEGTWSAAAATAFTRSVFLSKNAGVPWSQPFVAREPKSERKLGSKQLAAQKARASVRGRPHTPLHAPGGANLQSQHAANALMIIQKEKEKLGTNEEGRRCPLL